jgi:hypothetical protein
MSIGYLSSVCQEYGEKKTVAEASGDILCDRDIPAVHCPQRPPTRNRNSSRMNMVVGLEINLLVSDCLLARRACHDETGFGSPR